MDVDVFFFFSKWNFFTRKKKRFSTVTVGITVDCHSRHHGRHHGRQRSEHGFYHGYHLHVRGIHRSKQKLSRREVIYYYLDIFKFHFVTFYLGGMTLKKVSLHPREGIRNTHGFFFYLIKILFCTKTFKHFVADHHFFTIPHNTAAPGTKKYISFAPPSLNTALIRRRTANL